MKRVTAPPVFVAGTDYKSTSIELLERLSLDENSRTALLRGLYDCLSSRHSGAEVALLSTCNRLEIYWTEGGVAEMYRGLADEQGPESIDDTTGERNAIYRALAIQTGVSEKEIGASLRVLGGSAAIEHLFRVAAGIESMVIGEHQILGQVEEAWRESTRAGTAGTTIGVVFGAAVRCGRRSRADTSIGRNPRDVSTVAVQLAESVVGELVGRRVLVAGVGEMGRLTVKALHHRGVDGVDIVNRGQMRAQEAAERWGATAHPMDRLPALLEVADIMIASTASTESIVDREAIESIMERRAYRPLVLIDLAMPRDIAPEAGAVRGVHLFDLDGLKGIAEKGEQERRSAVPEVEAIVDEEILVLRSDLGDRAVRPVLSELWSRAEEVRREVLDSAKREMGQLSPEQVASLERMSRLLTNKLLHSPSARLRSETTNGRAVEYAEVLAQLFGLRQGGSEELREEHSDGRSLD